MSECSVDPRTLAGDPFPAAARDQDHPYACLGGYVFIGHLVESEADGEEVEVFEGVPCKRCERGEVSYLSVSYLGELPLGELPR